MYIIYIYIYIYIGSDPAPFLANLSKWMNELKNTRQVKTMPDKSSDVPSIIVYSAIGAESLRIARGRNNPESFSTAIKPVIARMSTRGVSIGKINSSILKSFNKYHSDFTNVCQSNQELLNLISKVINRYFLFIQVNQ